MKSSTKFTAVYQYTGVQIKIPEYINEINSLKEIANDLSSGVNTDLKKIDRIRERITNKASAISDSFTEFKSIVSLYSRIFDSETSVNNNALIQVTTNRIVNDSITALKAQGNINPEVVKNLLPNERAE